MISKERTVCDPNCHANPKCGLSATVENGRIVEIGTHDELASADGVYAAQLRAGELLSQPG